MRVRDRKIATGFYTNETWVYNAPHTFTDYSFVEDEKITDEVHTWPPPKNGGLSDIGGYLEQQKFAIESKGERFEAHSNWDNPVGSHHNGICTFHAYHQKHIYQSNHELEWISVLPVTNAILMAKGTTAISRCAPTNPHASLSQTLGELRRDGIPAVPLLKAFQKGPRPRPTRKSAGGSEYLNVEFGWKPLFNDVRKIATAVRDSDRVLKQYERDSGRLVRRRYEFPPTLTTTVVEYGAQYPATNINATLLGVPKGKHTRTDTVSQRIWFEGGFTYHVSGASDLASRIHRSAQLANHLLGVGVSPAVLYDLTPWSWALDWVTNTGDVINNASMMALDGLVVVYGYVMAETVATRTWTNIGAQVKARSGLYPPMTLSQSYVRTIRQRRRATPFGFGLTDGVFTPRQLAIVAALGMSRDGRKLAI